MCTPIALTLLEDLHHWLSHTEERLKSSKGKDSEVDRSRFHTSNMFPDNCTLYIAQVTWIIYFSNRNNSMVLRFFFFYFLNSTGE